MADLSANMTMARKGLGNMDGSLDNFSCYYLCVFDRLCNTHFLFLLLYRQHASLDQLFNILIGLV
jgi:hypothetical protein